MGYTGQLPEHKKLDEKGKLREPEGELLDALNEMFDNIKLSSCFRCSHLNEDEVSCKAYPDVIPREILIGDVPHDKPYEGDNGIQFEEAKKS